MISFMFQSKAVANDNFHLQMKIKARDPAVMFCWNHKFFKNMEEQDQKNSPFNNVW